MAIDERGSEWVELSASSQPTATHSGRAGASLDLHPRSAAQLVDLGAEVFVARLLACVGICTLIWFPLRAVMPFFVNFMSGNPFGYGGSAGRVDSLLTFTAMLLAQNLAAILSTTTVTILVHAELVGRSTSPMAALGRTLRRLPALIGTYIAYVGIIAAGGGLLMVLGFLCPPFMLLAVGFYAFFAWRWSVASSALVLEDLGVIEALRRSWDLTRGSFLRWLGVAVLSFLLVSGLSAGMQVGDNPSLRYELVAAIGIPGAVFDTIFVVISSVFSGISTGFISAAVTAYYLDSRIRREGFDLSMRLERMRAARGQALATR